MGVPSRITQKIMRLELAHKHVEDRKRGDAEDQGRRQHVAVDSRARRALLLDLATDVFRVRDDFAKSREGKRFWELIGSGTRLFAYADWFWDGLPVLEGNGLGAHTRVYLDGPAHHFLVEEWRNDDAGTPMAYREVCRLTSPLQMVDHPQFHPLMIEGLQTHLSGPGAWEEIEREIDSRLARYVTAP